MPGSASRACVLARSAAAVSSSALSAATASSFSGPRQQRRFRVRARPRLDELDGRRLRVKSRCAGGSWQRWYRRSFACGRGHGSRETSASRVGVLQVLSSLSAPVRQRQTSHATEMSSMPPGAHAFNHQLHLPVNSRVERRHGLRLVAASLRRGEGRGLRGGSGDWAGGHHRGGGAILVWLHM